MQEFWRNIGETAEAHHVRYQPPESINGRLQCLDHPIENVLGMVKIGRKIGGRYYWILTHNELELSFPTQTTVQSFTKFDSKLEIRSVERGICPIAVLYFAVKRSFFNI